MSRASNLAGFSTSIQSVAPNNLVVGVVTATTFSGNVTGNVTGNATGLTGTPNLNVGVVTATTFSGNLTGIATNVRGSAGRVLYNSSTDTTATSGNLTFNGTTLSVNSTPGANTSALAITGTAFGSSTKNGLLGVGTLGFTDSNLIANFTDNVNSYAQVILQNLNSGNAASADFVVNSDSPLGQTYYGDFGINGTAFSGGGPFGDTSGTYLYSKGGTLSVGTDDAQDFRIATGSAVATPVTRVTVTGIGGSVGIATTNPVSKLDLFGASTQSVVAIAASDINCSLGNYFTDTVNGSKTYTVSNVPSSRAYSFTLEVTHTTGTITWFSNLEWPGGTAPTLTTGKTHLFMFITDDGGSRWRGSSLVNYTN